MTRPITKLIELPSPNWNIKNAGKRCKSATKEPARSSAESRLRTPSFRMVEIRLILPAINSATEVCSCKNETEVVKLMSVKNI